MAARRSPAPPVFSQASAMQSPGPSNPPLEQDTSMITGSMSWFWSWPMCALLKAGVVVAQEVPEPWPR